MTRDELAALLNGRAYRHEITKDEEAQAKAAGLLVIFGASYDLVEFRGAIHDEIGGYNGTTFKLCADGLLAAWPDDVDEGWSESEAEEYFTRKALGCVELEAKWDHDGFSWVIDARDLPHSTFVILDDSDNYCRGVVINMADLKPAPAVALKLAGEVYALGLHSTDVPNLIGVPYATLRREDGGHITLAGLTEDECKALIPLFEQRAQISVGAA